MSKQQITEQELLAKVAKLQEQMDQSVEEGWWGDNMPELLGGDPAKAPMKLAVTPKNYARVQKMLPALYKAAQVDPNADEIVKQRFGVYLPPYEKWDGTVPSGRGDFLTRNVFGRSGAAAAEAEGTKAQQAEVERQQRIEANSKKLSDLYAKLEELLPAAFAKAEAPAAAAPAQATPVKESLAESMKRLSLMLAEKVTLPADGSAPKTQQYTTPSGATFTGNAPAEAPAGHPAEEVIKEINDTIAAIEADDPDDEDIEMINIVKEKVAQCQNIIKQEAEKKPVTPADTVNPDEEEKAKEVARAEREKQYGATQDAEDANVAGDGGTDPYVSNGQSNIPPGTPAQPKMSWQEIYDLNKSIIGNNPNLIKPGQVFELPNGGGKYTVVPGDTLSGIAAGQGKGKYETHAVPQQPGLPKKPVAPQFTPKVAPPTVTAPFKKELPPEMQYRMAPKSTTGTYQHLDVSDPKIKAMQAAADKDPNNASFRTTIREEQSLARIVSLVNYGK